MHLLYQQHKQLICLFFIFVTQTTSIPIKETLQNIRCNILHQNCTFTPRTPSPNVFATFTNSQAVTSRTTTRARTSTWPMSITSRLRSTTKSSSVSDFDAFSENLKRAAFILAAIALALGILRVCLMLCKSRSPSTRFSNRHSATIRPHVATIEQHQFKPDLPPQYAEVIANTEYASGGGKLPTYDELPDEQRQEQYGYHNDGFISTQM